MRVKMTAVAILALPLLLPAPGEAQDPATVGVRVELVYSPYRDRWIKRDSVENAAADVLADFLGKQAGFLRFAAGDATTPYKLSFLLDRRERNSTTSTPDIGFWLRLDRPTETPIEAWWLPFRSADQATAPIGTPADFIAELRIRLSHADAGPLRDSVLRWAPVTETALPVLTPVGLVLAFDLDKLCLKTQSELEFLAEVKNPITMELTYRAVIVGPFAPAQPSPALQPYVGGIRGKVIDLTQDDLSPSIQQGTAKVKQVFVVKPKHNPIACQAREPIRIGGSTP